MFKNLDPAALGVSGRDSEIIELTLSHGFKGLQLDQAELLEAVKSQGFAKATRSFVSARLKLGSFNVPEGWLDGGPSFDARLAALVDLAPQLGCTRAVVQVEPASDSRPYHQNFELHQRRLKQVAETLATHKIKLGMALVAPHACKGDRHYQFMQKADELLMLLGMINSTNLGLALDTWHWHLGGGTLEQLRSVADRIVTVCLSDADPALTAATAKLSDRKLPGEGGAIDNAAVLTVLGEQRYDGPVTPLADPAQLTGLSREQIVKSTAAALDTAWKAAGLSPLGKLSTVTQ